MSRDLIVSRVEPDEAPPRVSPRGRLVAGLVASVLVLGGVLVTQPWQGDAVAGLTGRERSSGERDGTGQEAAPDVPLAEGLSARLLVDPADATVDRVRGSLRLTNTGPQDRPFTTVSLTGLGTAFVGVAADASVPAGGAVELPVTVIAECDAVRDERVRVLVGAPDDAGITRVERADLGAAAADPYAVVGTLCPPPRPGLHVAATLARGREDGSVLARLVNTGTRPALVTVWGPGTDTVTLAGDVPFPLDLGPGDAVLLRLTVVVEGCDDAGTARPRLQVEAPEGYTAVEDATDPAAGGGLDAAVDAAVSRAIGRDCEG